MVPSNVALQQLLIAEFHNILVGGHVASSEHITISAGHSIGQTRKKKKTIRDIINNCHDWQKVKPFNRAHSKHSEV